tara:strand:+ start:68 stop:226 length:159 start_codon:yes stop_codon:yes gene_type:complete
MNKHLVKYFVDQVKEMKLLDEFYKETILEHIIYLKGKPKTLKSRQKNSKNKL